MKSFRSLPLICCICMVIFFACKQPVNNANTETLFELLPSGATGIAFANKIDESEDLNILNFEYFYNGAGVGAGDFNRDGLQDLFFCSNMGKSTLYINKGNLKFEDATEKSNINTEGKWAAGVSVVDINQDSLPDLYICYGGPWEADKRANELYINNGDLTFTEKAAAYGLADTGHSVQSVFFDYDRDGDLDMYLLTNITDELGPNVIRKKKINGEMVNTDRLYRNNGNGTFTNVSKEAGILIEGYGLGVSVCDINEDGWPDIYVSNDYLSNDLFYINNRNGTFTDHAADIFKHTSYSAMGNDVSDFNNDGRLDVCVMDMLPPDNYRKKMMLGATPYDRYRSELQYGYAPQFMRNTLQLNRGFSKDGLPAFSEIGQLSGVDATDWSWSVLFADLDNDGWRDLFMTNGYPRDITNRDFMSYRAQELMKGHYDESVSKRTMAALKELDGAYLHNFVFQNRGDLTFKDQSDAWGFQQKSYSTGAAYVDLDNDGDLDIITNNTGAAALIYKNNSDREKKNYLKIKLNGPKGNLQGYGAKITLYANGQLNFTEHYTVRGYQSTVDENIHFGLGAATQADSLKIVWPDGRIQNLANIKANQLLVVQYADSQATELQKNQTSGGLFGGANDKYNVHYQHKETPYTDFNIQPLLPHKFSQHGAGIAVADVNGDGRDDFFAGGAYNQSGQLFIQQADGRFTPRPLDTGKKYEEDMGALFFDADGDGDADLYVVSGGNEFEVGSVYYQDRLYINDGKGNFVVKKDALPVMNMSGSCVIAADYDQDGDLDLFVGSRLQPQHYPEGGRNRLLENNNGIFTDVTDAKAKGLSDIGMVTSALWTDVNADNSMDLILVGEWMPVTIFVNNKGVFANATEQFGLSHTVGWWNSIQAADFDQDGKTDYVLGNLGLNSRFKTSAADPLKIYANDFAGNGNREFIIAYQQDGVSYPIHPRDDVMQRMPFIKKKYHLYKDYAQVTMSNLFAPEVLQKSKMIQAHTFESAVLFKNGNQPWKLQPLPIQAQFAPVFGMLANDYDGDTYADILLTGNWYATEVISGQYDAMKGLYLKGNGKGGFEVKDKDFVVEGDAKGLAEIVTTKNKQLIISLINNDSLKLLEKNTPIAGQLIKAKADDAFVLITLGNGKKLKQELYYGAGYLSQSGRYISIPAEAISAEVYNYKSEKRTLTINRNK